MVNYCNKEIAGKLPVLVFNKMEQIENGNELMANFFLTISNCFNARMVLYIQNY